MNSFTKILKATEKRYSERDEIRDDVRQKLDTGLVLQADSPERVEKRLERLGFEPSTAKLLANSDLKSVLPTVRVNSSESSNIALERIIHKSDLMGVNYLERGVRSARSVGRIHIRLSNGAIAGYGTGFLVSPQLLLTNNHVLPDAETASFSQIEFNFQDGIDAPIPSVIFKLVPNRFFITDERLDYSLVAVQDDTQSGSSLSSFNWHPLIGLEGKVITGESVSIIQHPSGEPKQVALRENQIIDVLPDFLHYQTDTAPGSSGSPVFNDQWEVVALHHSGVPKRDSRGRILSTDGKPWTESQGEHRIAWIANEGVRISRIVQHIKQQTLSSNAQLLREQMFNSKPQPSSQNSSQPSESSVEVPVSQSLPQSSASPDGTITWTIPLQVSVRLGQPVIATPSIPVSAVPPGSSVPQTAPATSSDEELAAAIAEFQAASKRPYYDEAIDEQHRAAYYSSILTKIDSLSSTELYRELSKLVSQTHKTKTSYQPSRHLYPWVDLHPDRKLRSIYSEQSFNPEELIRADFRVDQLRSLRIQELRLKESLTSEQLANEIDLLEAGLPYNCEHVVPQSWFAKKEPMRGDLHHLFACEVRCNSFRGNTPYFEFDDFGEAIRDNCGKASGEKFEPNAGKGPAARATLYFLLRYPGEINKTVKEYQEDRLKILLDWHESDPVTEYEQHRNAAIYEKQGNRNPLIDFPEWADKIAFRSGLG